MLCKSIKIYSALKYRNCLWFIVVYQMTCFDQIFIILGASNIGPKCEKLENVIASFSCLWKNLHTPRDENLYR